MISNPFLCHQNTDVKTLFRKFCCLIPPCSLRLSRPFHRSYLSVRDYADFIIIQFTLTIIFLLRYLYEFKRNCCQMILQAITDQNIHFNLLDYLHNIIDYLGSIKIYKTNQDYFADLLKCNRGDMLNGYDSITFSLSKYVSQLRKKHLHLMMSYY